MRKILVIACMMLFVFCAPKKTTVETKGLEEVVVFNEDTLATQGPLAPPAEEPMPAEAVAIAPPPIEEPTVRLLTAETPPPTTPVVEARMIYGFRIQIFASLTEKNAGKVADDVRSAFAEKIHVDYVAPYYKIRVGDCLTREDAEFLKSKALKLGYQGAFIVETLITP